MAFSDSLSIIIPTFNEAKTLSIVISRVLKAAPHAEIILVDDGSTDETFRLKKKWRTVAQIKLLTHPYNLGKGRAIQSGLTLATRKYILIQDADLEYDPEDYRKLLHPIMKGNAEVVYGNRFLGEHRNLLFWNLVANRILNLLANILYNTTLSDLETGYKVFKSSILKSLTLNAKGFEFEPEVTAKILKKGVYIYEVPISYVGRNYQEGKKIHALDAFVAIWTLLKYRLVD